MIQRDVPDAPEPHAALAALVGRPGPFLIENHDVGEGRPGRCSFAGADPHRVFARADAGLGALPVGAAGYVLPCPARHESCEPAVEFGVYDTLVCWDHSREGAMIASTAPAGEGQVDRLQDALAGAAIPRSGPPRPHSPLRADMGRDQFTDAVGRAVEASRSSVALHFEVRSADEPLAVYLRFRKTLSAPVTAFFGGPAGEVIACSSGMVNSPPDADHATFGIRGAGGWLQSPIYRAVTHHDGVYSFRTVVSVCRDSDPADAYRRSLAEARPLAAVLGFRL